MAVNRGKDFEAEIRKAFTKCDNLVIERYPDPAMGYLGIRTFCDFMVYKYPFQYFFECKSVNGNVLNYQSAITENQWNGLIEKSKIKGVGAGIIVWFIKHDFTAFVPIQELKADRDAGSKSLHIDRLTGRDMLSVELNGRKKRVFFDYNAMDFMGRIEILMRHIWEEDWQKSSRFCHWK